MNQKSSVIQILKSVQRVLTSDMKRKNKISGAKMQKLNMPLRFRKWVFVSTYNGVEISLRLWNQSLVLI